MDRGPARMGYGGAGRRLRLSDPLRATRPRPVLEIVRSRAGYKSRMSVSVLETLRYAVKVRAQGGLRGRDQYLRSSDLLRPGPHLGFST